MRVVFMGTPEFAVASLAAVATEHQIACVYTKADAVSGRGGHTRPSPVAQFAATIGVNVRKPRTLKEPSEIEALQLLAPDVIVVAAYGLMLPKQVLDTPRFGCVNVHASLLPRWRGAAPIQRAILAGDRVTGVSIMRMEEGLDTGPYCQVSATEIGDDDTSGLTSRLAALGADAVLSALHHIELGSCEWMVQNEEDVTYADKITKDDVAVDPTMNAEAIIRRVKASSPAAPVRVRIGGKALTVLTAVHVDRQLAPGSVACTQRELILGACQGAVAVGRARPEGKSDMSACDWARGARLGESAVWESAR